MARIFATSFAAALLLLPSGAAAAPPRANATSPGLRGKSATVPAVQHMSGSCTAEDADKMAGFGAGNAEGTFPQIVAFCGKNSWSLFGGFNTREYETCIKLNTHISPPCASCFSISGLYGYRNCKLSCLFGSWCGRACLRCVEPSTVETKTCAGVPVPAATSC